jgi:hypothetical protein
MVDRERPFGIVSAAVKEMSGGKTAMWVIGTGILASLITTVIVTGGIDGVPGHWIGVAVALVFAAIAFALGNYE